MTIKKNLTSIKDFGKKALLVGGLAAVLSGCEQPRSVNQVLEDVNGDGRKDIINYMFDGSGWGSHDIYVALNKNGSFAEPRKVLRLKYKPTDLNVEDLDGDQIPDLSYVLFDGAGWGSWDMYSAKGNGDGTFQNPVKIRHYKSRPG